MKGLRKYIAPFAPDQSGAAAVLCEFHGLIIILDAGGCAGNICGFDEPRWFGSRSAIFSAGLRDMDAILGRDEKLVEKIGKACQTLSPEFIAVIGTPVPAVIGTDYRALTRMIEKKTGIPAFALDTDGTKLYDEGEKKAWKALFEKFVEPVSETEKGSVGILGATPLEFGGEYEDDFLKNYFYQKGFQKVVCYGMGDGLLEVKKAGCMEKNMVVSPAGLATAVFLEKTFGTPYEMFCPPEIIPEWQEVQNAGRDWYQAFQGKKLLIVHQQILAESLKKEILSRVDARIDTASWFWIPEEMKTGNEIFLREEDDWIHLVNEGDYDGIIADPILKRAVPDFKGKWWDLSHFAISGRKRKRVCL